MFLYMAEIITTLPLLLLSIIAWLVCLLIFIFYKEDEINEEGQKVKKGDDVIKRLFIYGLSFFFLISIISLSNINIASIEFDKPTNTTIVGESSSFAILKITLPFSAMLLIQLIYLIYYLYTLVLNGVFSPKM